jgi:hypothetical protein
MEQVAFLADYVAFTQTFKKIELRKFAKTIIQRIRPRL